MKTAISLPADTFALATERAAELGVSRSEFFATAAVHYLDELDRASLTQRIDSALPMVASDNSTQDAVTVGRRYLEAGLDIGDRAEGW